jgi:hypothetical protein
MIERMFADLPPTITFTYDFHELLGGNLRPGSQLRLLYDPLRIVPKGEPYLFGDPNRPIVAHAVFRKGDMPVSKPLISKAGILEHPVVDVTGGGSMLTTTFDVPEDAQTVCLWFTYASPESGTHADSDNDDRFWFPFVADQIKVVSADVITAAQGKGGEFTLTVSATPEVERITVRVRPVGGEAVSPDPELEKTGKTDGSWLHWSVRVPVPVKAIVQFKVYYSLDGIMYKDDNSGRYYLAPPPPVKKVPPMPKELMEVVSKWKA